MSLFAALSRHRVEVALMARQIIGSKTPFAANLRKVSRSRADEELISQASRVLPRTAGTRLGLSFHVRTVALQRFSHSQSINWVEN